MIPGETFPEAMADIPFRIVERGQITEDVALTDEKIRMLDLHPA
jgi:hypothetical protein